MNEHPFGLLINQFLAREPGFTQKRLGEYSGVSPSVLSKMCHGDRLAGDMARGRVLRIIRQLHEWELLESAEEANALLDAADMWDLDDNNSAEAALLSSLRSQASSEDHSRPDSNDRRIMANVPPRPALWVGREEQLEEARQQLLLSDHGREHRRWPSQLAVHGWPGVGKTSFSIELAHDDELADRYPDGVLWTSLDVSPDIFSQLMSWGRALDAPTVLRAVGVPEATERLTEVLRDRRMLLILDDVWHTEHVDPFRVGGPYCALMLTTRLHKIANALADEPNVYRLPVLSENSALELLRRLAPTVVIQHFKASKELVSELEYLPLAVQVAGRLLRAEAAYGWDVVELLRELREGSSLLEAQAPADMNSLAGQTMPSVAVLLKKSTDRLDDETRDRFALLGSMAPKPATFGLKTLRDIWSLPDPKPVVRTLVDRGLLEPVGDARFQMHALLVLLARSLLEP